MITSLMQNARFLQELLLTGLLIDATSKSEDYIVYMYILYFFQFKIVHAALLAHVPQEHAPLVANLVAVRVEVKTSLNFPISIILLCFVFNIVLSF